MAGQATIAHEIIEEIPDIDIIIASIGGGGLLSGISQYAKSINPTIRVYGVETVGADSMYQSLKAGKLITLPAITSVAESLGAKQVTEKTFNIIQKNVDDVFTVTDEQAIRELKLILQEEKLLVEPAASCSLSTVVEQKIPNSKGKKIAIVLCGGNFPIDELKTYL
jgi:threonine dehydratase